MLLLGRLLALARRATATATAATFTSGCSFFITRPPTVPPFPTTPIECTSSSAAPVADSVLAVIGVAIGVVGVSAESSCPPNELCIIRSESSHTAGAIALGIGAVALASSIYGFNRVGRCEDLKAWQAACSRGDAAACAALGGPDVPAQRSEPRP